MSPVHAEQETHYTGCTRGVSGAVSSALLARFSTRFFA